MRLLERSLSEYFVAEKYAVAERPCGRSLDENVTLDALWEPNVPLVNDDIDDNRIIA